MAECGITRSLGVIFVGDRRPEQRDHLFAFSFQYGTRLQDLIDKVLGV